MQALETTIYNCEWCKRWFRGKSGCARHEKCCSGNPANKVACTGCKHLSEHTHQLELTTGDYGRHTVPVRFFYCSKLQTAVYPPKVARSQYGPLDNLEIDGEWVDNVPMPSACDKREIQRFAELDIGAGM